MNIMDLTTARDVAAVEDLDVKKAQFLHNAPTLSTAIGGFPNAKSIEKQIAKRLGWKLKEVRTSPVIADWTSSNANNWQWYMCIGGLRFLSIYVESDHLESPFATGNLAIGEELYLDEVLA